LRRLAATVALAIGLAAAPTHAHPGHGPSEVQVFDDFFRPNQLTVATGDTVVWKWVGPAADHSVTADPGQAESFDSGTGHAKGFAFSHVFAQAGVFTYHCSVHAAMTGKVTVVALAPRDAVKPVIRGAVVRPGLIRATRAYLTVRMSERSTVVARVDQAAGGRWKLVRTFDFDAARGRDRHRLHVRGFDPGAYRVRLLAYDAVGNRSRGKRIRFRIARVPPPA
jgi:plastocyanin